MLHRKARRPGQADRASSGSRWRHPDGAAVRAPGRSNVLSYPTPRGNPRTEVEKQRDQADTRIKTITESPSQLGTSPSWEVLVHPHYFYLKITISTWT